MALEGLLSHDQQEHVRRIVRDELARVLHQIEPPRRICATCGGQGSTPGFWLGTIKTCPACGGTGRQ